MKLKSLITAVIVIAIIGGSIFGFRLVQSWHKGNQQEMKRSNAITVQVGKVGHQNLDEILTFNGDIQAIQSVDLMPKISGRLLSLDIDGVPVEEGVTVKKGQLIGKIDDRDLKAQVANARAAKASAEAAIVVAKANVASADAALQEKAREKDRQKKLTESHATTQQSYDLAITAYDQAKASAEAAKAQITSKEADLLKAEASLEQALVNLSETEIRAPMDGVVSKKNTDPGSMVSPTTTIVRIVAIDDVKIVISVPVTHLARLRPNQTQATLRTPSMPGKNIACTIHKIYPSVETVTRTAQVEIRVKNIVDATTGYQLKPGMYVTVDVLIEKRDKVLAIDSALPIRNLEKNIVYRVKRGNGTDVPDTVEAVNVKMGVRFKHNVEILDGLKEGDEIVVVGQHRLTDGAAVKIIPGNNLEL